MWSGYAHGRPTLRLASTGFRKLTAFSRRADSMYECAHRSRASRTARFHNVAAIHSCAILGIQLPFSFAPKHGERFCEPDIEEAAVNRGFLAPVPQRIRKRAATFARACGLLAGSFLINEGADHAEGNNPLEAGSRQRNRQRRGFLDHTDSEAGSHSPSLRDGCRHSTSPRANAGMRQRERGFFWGRSRAFGASDL